MATTISEVTRPTWIKLKIKLIAKYGNQTTEGKKFQVL
jgi:hypothetical protein